MLKIGILIMLFCACIATATTYYVCDSGSDCNAGAGSGWSTGSDSYDGLSKSKPFKTIQKAANSVSPGDIVIVGDGIYTDTDSDNWIVRMKNAGTSGKPITFKSENRHGAVLDGQNNDEKKGDDTG